jgi:hypothetical protein
VLRSPLPYKHAGPIANGTTASAGAMKGEITVHEVQLIEVLDNLQQAIENLHMYIQLLAEEGLRQNEELRQEECTEEEPEVVHQGDAFDSPVRYMNSRNAIRCELTGLQVLAWDRLTRSAQNEWAGLIVCGTALNLVAKKFVEEHCQEIPL